MKKFFSTLLVIVTVFAFTAFAGDPPPPTCAAGHMHLPGYVCTPPDNGNNGGNGNRLAEDDSTLTYIKTLIAEFDPFGFFTE